MKRSTLRLFLFPASVLIQPSCFEEGSGQRGAGLGLGKGRSERSKVWSERYSQAQSPGAWEQHPASTSQGKQRRPFTKLARVLASSLLEQHPSSLNVRSSFEMRNTACSHPFSHYLERRIGDFYKQLRKKKLLSSRSIHVWNHLSGVGMEPIYSQVQAMEGASLSLTYRRLPREAGLAQQSNGQEGAQMLPLEHRLEDDFPW